MSASTSYSSSTRPGSAAGSRTDARGVRCRARMSSPSGASNGSGLTVRSTRRPTAASNAPATNGALTRSAANVKDWRTRKLRPTRAIAWFASPIYSSKRGRGGTAPSASRGRQAPASSAPAVTLLSLRRNRGYRGRGRYRRVTALGYVSLARRRCGLCKVPRGRLLGAFSRRGLSLRGHGTPLSDNNRSTGGRALPSY